MSLPHTLTCYLTFNSVFMNVSVFRYRENKSSLYLYLLNSDPPPLIISLSLSLSLFSLPAALSLFLFLSLSSSYLLPFLSSMGIKLYGSSKHVARAWKKTGILNRQINRLLPAHTYIPELPSNISTMLPSAATNVKFHF